jgi:DNA (cytosine-5)-methyltransferase 1
VSGSTKPRARGTVLAKRPSSRRVDSSAPRALSLFSGAGGMDLGVESAGFHNVASIEFDANAVATLNENVARSRRSTTVLHADVRTVNPTDMCPRGVELLHGGPPCQAFSLIGKRESLKDDRGMLLFEMIRFAEVLRPKIVLIEQVKGLISAPDSRGVRGGVLKRLLADFKRLGYEAQYSVLCAADFGVAQLRERVFVVATQSTRSPFMFPQPSHAADPAQMPLLQLDRYLSVGEVIAGLPRPVPKGAAEAVENHVDVTPARDRERIAPVKEGGFLAGTLDAPLSLRGRLTAKDTTKYRRLSRKLPSLTLRCGEIFFHPTADRYLTPREYLRIHGYPDSHVLLGPVRGRTGTVKSLDQHRLVANSVPPPLAAAIARSLIGCLS